MSEETTEQKQTFGVGPRVTKCVPAKRLKRAWRQRNPGMRLKEWASRICDIPGGELGPLATTWLDNKAK